MHTRHNHLVIIGMLQFKLLYQILLYMMTLPYDLHCPLLNKHCCSSQYHHNNVDANKESSLKPH